ncbi:MAG: endonuclease/exonuclease/phosphatase family protein [Planctomycetota bacterium]
MPHEHPAKQRPGSIAATLGVLAWWAVLAAALWTLLGWVVRTDPTDADGIESTIVFAALLSETFAFHLGLGVTGVAAVALALGRCRTATAAVVLAATHLAPAAWLWVRPTPAPAGGPTLTVLSANIQAGNADAERLLEFVDRTSPDVVVVQEIDPAIHRGLLDGLASRFETGHAALIASPYFSQATYTNLPMRAPPSELMIGSRFPVPQIDLEIEFEGRLIRVLNVHAYPPRRLRLVADQRRSIPEFAAWARSAMADADATILAGDFNAPFNTGHLRELRAAGFREAHDEAGRGRGSTWPHRGVLRYTPGIRLDNIMFAGALRCVESRVLGDVGSDHRPILATFEIVPDDASSPSLRPLADRRRRRRGRSG